MQLMPIYRGISSVVIGNGAMTLFWKDLWCGQILADSYPRAFSFAANEDASVGDVLQAQAIGDVFHLPLSAQAREEVARL